MVSRRRIITLLLAVVLTVIAATAEAALTDTRTGIFAPTFKTLQLKVNGNDQLPPIVMIDSDDYLTIGFDELATDRRYLRYELLHCNATWMPDRLLPSEYVDGFNEGLIEDYRFSEATLVPYIHYELVIPDPNLRIKLSGNYLLRVYDENAPDDTLLQVRFCVAEPSMNVTASVTSRTDIDYNDAHQQVTVAVDARGLAPNHLMNDLIVTVEQNGRQDNVAMVNRPNRIAGNVAWWEHQPQLIFPAGNEYRRMETVSTTYPGMRVADITYADPLYHITLATDVERSDLPYSFDSTQKGRFRIREYNSDDSDVEADYVMTHFSLEGPEMRDADIFIDGDLTLRLFGPESLMVYNRASGLYEASMLLKQGAYNYQYLTVAHGSQRGTTAPVEGDKYQTANEYTIKVYYREPGARYDRLVAVTSVTAGV